MFSFCAGKENTFRGLRQIFELDGKVKENTFFLTNFFKYCQTLESTETKFLEPCFLETNGS